MCEEGLAIGRLIDRGKVLKRLAYRLGDHTAYLGKSDVSELVEDPWILDTIAAARLDDPVVQPEIHGDAIGTPWQILRYPKRKDQDSVGRMAQRRRRPMELSDEAIYTKLKDDLILRSR